jgi:oligopeptide/dipeptide ABC transporter ATP-binding protein
MAGSGTAHLRTTGETLLRADNLVVEFPVGKTGMKVHAVSDVSLDVREGETLGLVGESGCGKSTTGRALMQLPRPTSGSVRYRDTTLTDLGGDDLRRVRPEMQMIFQDPISSLNPRRKVRDIVAEPLRIWASDHNPPAGPAKTAHLLLRADAAVRVGLFAVLVAFWLINTAILGLIGVDQEDQLLRGVYQTFQSGATGLFLGAVMGGLAYLVSNAMRDRLPKARIWTWAYTVVSLLFAFGVVTGGEGWPAKLAWGLGSALALAAALLSLTANADFAAMADIRTEHDRLVADTLTQVGIPTDSFDRRPHEFSGGQCQRICIARSLVLDPKVIICDEPVSALDVSVQAQILNLLQDMKRRYGLTLVFIAHDLAVVKNVSDRVAVMYLGKLCEVAPPDELYAKPAHPYTDALLSSIPVPDPTRRPSEENVLGGELPSPITPPSGCRFRTRCPKAEDMCAQVEPKMRQIGLGHYVACHFPLGMQG